MVKYICREKEITSSTKGAIPMREIKHKTKSARVLFCCICFSVLIVFVPLALADTMQSASFKVQSDTISIGGGNGASTGFVLQDTIGEAATGENLSSASFRTCAGFQCLIQNQFIQLDIEVGTTPPGSSGSIDFGELSPNTVKTSDGATVNSVFVTASSNAPGGAVIKIRSQYSGLKSPTNGHTIPSTTAPLVAGTEGYGVCVKSATNITIATPYDGSCDYSSGNYVGLLDSTARTVLFKLTQFSNATAEILAKTATSALTPSASDYADSLTFTMTETY
jgi:hypothetical protein